MEQSLASVNRKTKQIVVSPKFYTLDKHLQEFVLLQIGYLQGNDIKHYFEADLKAAKEVIQNNPDLDIGNFIKKIILLLGGTPSSLNIKRMDNLTKNIK